MAQSDNFSPGLFHTYRERIRPILLSINNLRFQGLQHEIHLPAIVVVGDQSTGKSSVLESISGIEFPRGSGIVTRCPIQLSLLSRDDTKWNGIVKYTSKKAENKEIQLKHASEIENAIREAQNEITDSSSDVSDSIIEIHVEGADCPDLTLIDLPGIARYSSSSGKNIGTVTKNLILSYITQPEVIILVVIPLNVDIETVEGLALAKEADPEGTRTIGVLTCPDLVNKGAEDDALEIAKNHKIPLKKGYVTVKCRSQKELKDKITLKEAVKLEEIFFRNHPEFSTLNEFEYGSKNLASKLGGELFTVIKSNMPSMLGHIKNRREKYIQEMLALGSGIPEDVEEKNTLLIKMLSRFSKAFERVATGIHIHEPERLFSKCRDHWALLADEIEDCSNIGNATSDEFKEYVNSQIINQRGNELPQMENIFPVLQRMVQKFINMVRQPTTNFLASVNQEVNMCIQTMADDNLSDYPILNAYIKSVCEQLREKMMQQTRQDINKVFEQENYVFTQDKLFNQELQVVAELQEETSSVDSATGGSDVPQTPTPKQKLKNHFSIGSSKSKKYKGLAQAFALAKTKKGAPFKEREVNLVIQGVRGYLRVATRRMMDTIPMTAIYFMLHEMSRTIENQIMKLIAAPEKLYDMLEENEEKRTKRKYLQDRIAKLDYAEKELIKLH